MSGEDSRLTAVLPLIRKPCDVFELVAALHQYKDVAIQDVLCSKLYEAKSHEVEFFLPQLCNIILHRSDAEVAPLWNFILDKCRMSLHLGLLVHFIFQGAVEDQQMLAGQVETAGLLRCQGLLGRVHAVTINSSQDHEMAHIIRLFTNHQLQKERNRKRVASVASRASMAQLNIPSFPSTSTSPSISSSLPSNPGQIMSSAPIPMTTQANYGKNGLSGSVSSYSPSLSGLGPSTSSGSRLAANDGVGSLEAEFQDLQLTMGGGDSEFIAPIGGLPPMNSTLKRRTVKPVAQFTLATEPDLLEPEVDHRPMESKPIETSPDEFNEHTYHTQIGQWMTPLAEADQKTSFDLFTDGDMTEFEAQLQSTPAVEDFSVFSSLVTNLVHNLPSFDFDSPEQANSSITSLNNAMLELERAYLKTNRTTTSKAPPSNAPSSLKKSNESSQDGSSSHHELSEDENIAFCASLEQELLLKKFRQRYFRSEWNFIATLTGISSLLKHSGFKTKEQKTKALRICLQEFNAEFARGVYMPILRRKGKTYRVIRIPYKEAFTLNSRDRVPYMMFIEAVSGDEHEEIPDLQTASSTNSIATTSATVGPESNINVSHSGLVGGLSDPSDPSNHELYDSPTVSIRDSEDQKVTRSLQKMEIIDEWVVVDKNEVVPEPPSLIERIYKETWAKKAARVRKTSPVGNRKNWELISVVMKSGDDLRQEQLATQLIRLFYDIFQRSGLNLWVYPYEVLAVSSQGGFIETIPDALSIHTIKEELGADPSLRNYFMQAYGTTPNELKKAKLNFIESLAAYSLICYIMQIKDRHNGNILLDTQGHLIHIDYGFMLTSSPGSLNFENAPFKLTVEFVEVMDGRSSPLYAYFRTLFQSGFLAIRAHYKSILSIVQMMEAGSNMACFAKGPQTMKLLEDRFKMQLSEEEAIKYADDLINYSEGNWRTDSYDTYQALTNGIRT
jgi:phosphatidylinositol 4-kinase